MYKKSTKIKVLNLYSGLGGNRKFWSNCDVTAVEYNESVANYYKAQFPEDTVIVGDAHQYLLDHSQEYNLIWLSPPCPSHSKIRFTASKAKSYKPVYPDMKLWESIIFLKENSKDVKWVVENVLPYYPCFEKPSVKLGRHYFWANFDVEEIKFSDGLTHNERCSKKYAFMNIDGFNFTHRPDQLIRNAVHPHLGLFLQNVYQSMDSKNLLLIEKIPQVNNKSFNY